MGDRFEPIAARFNLMAPSGEPKPYRYENIREPLPFEQLITLDFSLLPLDEAVDRVAQLVEDALDNRRPDLLVKAREVATSLRAAPDIPLHDQSNLDYYVANSWSYTRCLEGKPRALEDRNGAALEIFHLRRAVNGQGFDAVSVPRQAQMLTNLGNSLSNIGRTVEALAYWERAIQKIPNFGMARGNRGYGLLLYAWDLHDPHEFVLLLREAKSELDGALEVPLEGNASRSFQESLGRIESILSKRDDKHITFPDSTESADSNENAYRVWCADNRLFLNPLNDLSNDLVVARDTLRPAPTAVPVETGPRYLGFLSQMKQEYASARYFAYRSRVVSGPHFSDKHVELADTLDYPSFSLSTEYSKASFRAAYSIFDKIAFFLNAYFDLEIPAHKVSFKKLWFEGNDPEREFRDELRLDRNRPLNALYWLSRDLYERDDKVQAAMDPDARALADTRNQLEHRYLKLHMDLWSPPQEPSPLDDDLAYSVGRSAFDERLLRILSMARSGLIYLTLTITREERMRDELQGGPEERGINLPMRIPQLPDDWKL